MIRKKRKISCMRKQKQRKIVNRWKVGRNSLNWNTYRKWEFSNQNNKKFLILWEKVNPNQRKLKYRIIPSLKINTLKNEDSFLPNLKPIKKNFPHTFHPINWCMTIAIIMDIRHIEATSNLIDMAQHYLKHSFHIFFFAWYPLRSLLIKINIKEEFDKRKHRINIFLKASSSTLPIVHYI